VSVEDVQRALAAAVHENNELRAALGRVATLVDRLEQRGCISCSSLTGGDFIAEELREALGEAKSNVRLENRS